MKAIFRAMYLFEIKRRIARVGVEKIFIEETNKQALKRDLKKMEDKMETYKSLQNKSAKLKNEQIKLFREIEETKKAKQDMEMATRKLKELKELSFVVKRNLWT